MEKHKEVNKKGKLVTQLSCQALEERIAPFGRGASCEGHHHHGHHH